MGRIIWERTEDGLKPYQDGLLVKTESGLYFVNQKGKVQQWKITIKRLKLQ
jgi:hypothetical protein